MSEVKLQITIKDAGLCPRYQAVVMELPAKLGQKYLKPMTTDIAKAGMRAIDPIVDATNYLMLLTGQPLHAFDYDKLVEVGKRDDAHIIVRGARDGEKMTLLDGKEIAMGEGDIVITSNDVPVALAGAMGGANTAIDENTRRIVVESATFNLYNLRGTQFRHGIFSEAITRFTKGQPAALTDFVICEFINMTERDLGLKVISEVVDAYPKPVKPSVVKITTEQVNGLLGTDFTFDEIIMTLENVGFKVKLDNGILRVVAPWWRTDIHIAEDVIEEVGRLNGYDEIPTQLPRRGFASPTDDELGELKAKLRKVLSDAGANEVLTYSFVSERLLRNVGQDPKNSYKIVNSISPQLQYVRQSLTPSLLEKTYTNIKVPYDHFALFEINQVYQKAYGLNEEKVPVLRDKVSLVVANRKASGDAYYEALNYALMLLQSLNIPVCIVALKDTHASNAPFEPARSAQLKTLDHKICFGVVGEYRQMVRRNLKLPEYTAGFELNVDEIFVYQGKTAPKTPVDNVVSNDLTFRVGADLEYAKLENLLQKNLESKSLWYQLTPISIYQGEDSKTKNISFRLNFANYEKTLSGKEIASIINGIANNVKKNLKGEMI